MSFDYATHALSSEDRRMKVQRCVGNVRRHGMELVNSDEDDRLTPRAGFEGRVPARGRGQPYHIQYTLYALDKAIATKNRRT